jgi:hypothetical protein
MVGPFTLVVPNDPRFRPIAPDVAGRLAEIAGGAAAGVSAAVAGAIETIAKECDANESLTLTFRAGDKRVDVDVKCGPVARTITCPL